MLFWESWLWTKKSKLLSKWVMFGTFDFVLNFSCSRVTISFISGNMLQVWYTRKHFVFLSKLFISVNLLTDTTAGSISLEIQKSWWLLWCFDFPGIHAWLKIGRSYHVQIQLAKIRPHVRCNKIPQHRTKSWFANNCCEWVRCNFKSLKFYSSMTYSFKVVACLQRWKFHQTPS